MDRVDYQPLILQDIVTWKKNNEIELSPWYQRREVWSTPQKSYLINTLFEQKPVPTLYFRHRLDLELDKSLREVVDGQQRSRAILEYIENQFPATHPEHKKKVKYSQLSNLQKRRFRETQLSGGWLLGASDADVIEIFGRLNSVSKTLNPAEKRNSKYGGEFKQFCLAQAASRVSLWREFNVFSANDIARMQEIQFVADVILNLMEGLSDYSAPKLDKIYKQQDETFPRATEIQNRLEKCFSLIAQLPTSAIADTIFRRQPIFFSLLIVIDKAKGVRPKSLEEAIYEMDGRYNVDSPLSERTKDDVEFYEACRASTQRIKSRRVRDRYISRHVL